MKLGKQFNIPMLAHLTYLLILVMRLFNGQEQCKSPFENGEVKDIFRNCFLFFVVLLLWSAICRHVHVLADTVETVKQVT